MQWQQGIKAQYLQQALKPKAAKYLVEFVNRTKKGGRENENLKLHRYSSRRMEQKGIKSFKTAF